MSTFNFALQSVHILNHLVQKLHRSHVHRQSCRYAVMIMLVMTDHIL
jgi:hypothetical protein